MTMTITRKCTLNRAMQLCVAFSLALPLAAQQSEVVTLEEAVNMALEQGRDVRDARLALEVAREQVSEQWAALLPKIDLSASYGRNLKVAQGFLPAIIFDPNASPSDLVAVRFGSDNSWNSAINVEQKLFAPGVFVGLGAANRFENLQSETVRGRRQAVVTRTRIGFYNLLLAQEQRRLTENSVRRVRESLDETRALNAAGLAADFDVLRLEVELANLEPNLMRARNAIRDAKRQLAIEMNVKDLEGIAVAGRLADLNLDDPTSNDMPNQGILAFSGLIRPETKAVEELFGGAQESRSDLRQLELTEQLRRTELRFEQVQYLPEITLFGSWTVLAQQDGKPNFFGSSSQQRTFGATAGVRVSFPIFQGFSRDARIDQKRATLRQAETQSRLALSQAEGEVKALRDQVEEARLRARGQQFAVTQAHRGFEIASAQYREGLGSQLELTDAEVALRQSEFNYAQAVYDYLVGRAQLDLALGRVPLVDEWVAGQ
jgi:outer membrane protein